MIDRLIKAIIEKDNPTVAGLDPRPALVPGFLWEKARAEYGDTPEAVAESYWQFNKGLIDALCELVPAVKPQIAMYEAYGVAGLKAYEKTVRYAREKGLVVIGDCKRGDIASTAASYADAHLGKVKIGDSEFEGFPADMLTVNPYLGEDAVAPFFDTLKKYDRGLFILVKTSNPGSGQLQDLPVSTGGETRPLYEVVGGLVEKWGEDFRGGYGYSDIGAVVGATHPAQGKRLREILPHTFFLVPGYGAQGATAQDLSGCFDKNGLGAIVNSSRGIIGAWKKPEYLEKFGEEGYAEAARAAVIAMREDLNGALR